MLRFDNLALRRGPRLLFDNASFTIHRGNRVGLTGANGTGKSSLFELLLGRLDADSGELRMPPDLMIAHVAQETPASDRPAIEFVMDGDRELRALQSALKDAERSHDGHRQAELHAKVEAVGGYGAQARAAQLMHGLGFPPGQEEMPVNAFSGGWRMRLNLAQALMCRSDLLLLDEPTNHLDLDAVIWLEAWLRQYAGTLLLISHDREFLDSITGHIAHIEQNSLSLYTGNYSAFEVQRAAQLAGQQSAFEKQQREIRHIHQFVTRFRAKATKARQAQSRLKALERMELIAPAHVDSQFHFSFREPEKLPNGLLTLDKVKAAYGEQVIINEASLNLVPGQRLGLLGHNGAGKSTFTRLLAGMLPPASGSYLPAKDLQVGYFAQHQLEQLDLHASALLHLQRLDGSASEQQLRDYLGGFGFSADRVEMPVAPFSGGEKARLVLAMVVYQKPNLLLLDEPTNHLDLEMRHALTIALQDYSGALVLVSHDRHLMRSVIDEFYLVHAGRVQAFAGDIDDYPRWLAEQQRAGEESSRAANTVSRKEQRQAAAKLRQQLQPLRTKARTLEAEIAGLADGLQTVEQKLADPAIYSQDGKQDLAECLREQGRLQRLLSDVESAWLEACEELEYAEAACGINESQQSE